MEQLDIHRQINELQSIPFTTLKNLLKMDHRLKGKVYNY